MQKATGRDVSNRVGPFKPKGKSQVRKWWYPVIHHHKSTADIAKKYGRRFPIWLLSEIEKVGPLEWLWSHRQYLRCPGKGVKPKAARRRLTAKLVERRAKGSIHQSPHVIAERLARRMRGVEVMVRTKDGDLAVRSGPSK